MIWGRFWVRWISITLATSASLLHCETKQANIRLQTHLRCSKSYIWFLFNEFSLICLMPSIEKQWPTKLLFLVIVFIIKYMTNAKQHLFSLCCLRFPVMWRGLAVLRRKDRCWVKREWISPSLGGSIPEHGFYYLRPLTTRRGSACFKRLACKLFVSKLLAPLVLIYRYQIIDL